MIRTSRSQCTCQRLMHPSVLVEVADLGAMRCDLHGHFIDSNM
jgi:hypothetical protein